MQVLPFLRNPLLTKKIVFPAWVCSLKRKASGTTRWGGHRGQVNYQFVVISLYIFVLYSFRAFLSIKNMGFASIRHRKGRK